MALAELGRGRCRHTEVIENLAPQLVRMNDGMTELALEFLGAGERRNIHVAEQDRRGITLLVELNRCQQSVVVASQRHEVVAFFKRRLVL